MLVYRCFETGREVDCPRVEKSVWIRPCAAFTSNVDRHLSLDPAKRHPREKSGSVIGRLRRTLHIHDTGDMHYTLKVSDAPLLIDRLLGPRLQRHLCPQPTAGYTHHSDLNEFGSGGGDTIRSVVRHCATCYGNADVLCASKAEPYLPTFSKITSSISKLIVRAQTPR